MSDATLPAPCPSSAAPHIDNRNCSDSSSGEGDFDTTLGSSASGIGKDSGATEYNGGGDGKQKRKRTRYVDLSFLQFPELHISIICSSWDIEMLFSFKNMFADYLLF